MLYLKHTVSYLLTINRDFLMYHEVGVPWKNRQKWPVFNLLRAITQPYVVFSPKA